MCDECKSGANLFDGCAECGIHSGKRWCMADPCNGGPCITEYSTPPAVEVQDRTHGEHHVDGDGNRWGLFYVVVDGVDRHYSWVEGNAERLAQQYREGVRV